MSKIEMLCLAIGVALLSLPLALGILKLLEYFLR